MSSSGSGTVINYGSGSDFLTSYSSGQCCGTVTIYYGSGSGFDFWKVMIPVPVPTFEKL